MLQSILTSPVTLVVLAVLMLFSIGSWAIMIQKAIVLRFVKRSNRAFTELFWEVKDFDAVKERLPSIRSGPVVRLFRDGYRETMRLWKIGTGADDEPRLTADAGPVENVSRAMRKASAEEIASLERDVGFLATAGATTPFIGLFGTVWGIMNAFQNIGTAGSTSLAVVAPGISEALITTAIGLAVAIPAVIGYNWVQGKIKQLVSEIDGFSYDFLNIVQKLFAARRGEASWR